MLVCGRVDIELELTETRKRQNRWGGTNKYRNLGTSQCFHIYKMDLVDDPSKVQGYMLLYTVS